jgi:two-component system response regulator BaeR
MGVKQHILIVEDETKIAELLRDYLEKSDYLCTVINNGDEVMPWLGEHTPNLIVLDLMLPGTDGLSLCSQIRRDSKVAIIILTARVEEIDRLLGLELGADDYICKPFSLKEVVARVKAVLRRTQLDSEIKPYGLLLNMERCQLTIYTQVISLTRVEANLMQILLEKPGRIFSRDTLMDSMYSDHRIVSERTIDSHIKKLRKKIKYVLPENELIESVYGIGYKLDYEALPEAGLTLGNS